VRFAVTDGVLRQFRDDRVALWVVVMLRDGRGSGPMRLRSDTYFAEQSQRARVFSNKRGGVGIDLRA
ncbi:MAG TPA: hypothetical protein H9830_13140, partial [Candidatus Agrococcus pullicola]|nr:hypothetical protein [Candidatus Agrococcus pullicola]